jgi:hypothetical protein
MLKVLESALPAFGIAVVVLAPAGCAPVRGSRPIKRPPDEETVIQQTVGGTPIAPPGLTLVCSGHAFVTGQLTMLAGFAQPR